MMLFDGHTLGLRQAVVVTAVGVAKSVLLAKEQLGIKSTLGAVVVCQKIGNHVPVSGCDI
jgi:hypothetical protein